MKLSPIAERIEQLAEAAYDYKTSELAREESARELDKVLHDPASIDSMIDLVYNARSDLTYNIVLEALPASNDPRAITAIIDQYHRGLGFSGHEWENGVEALAKFGDLAFQPLMEALRDKNENVRTMAASALGLLKDKRAVPALIEVLKEYEQYDSAEYITKALASIGGNGVFEVLTGLLRSDLQRWSSRIAKDLGILKDQRAYTVLVELAKSSDIYTRAAALKSLGALGEDTALVILTEGIKDTNDFVASSAARGLILNGSAAALELLRQVLDDDRPQVVDVAKLFFEKGFRYDHWH